MKTETCKCGGKKRKGYLQCRTCFLTYYKTRTEKLCVGCNRTLSLECFRKRPDGKRPRSRCKECEARNAREWRKDNPEEHKRRKKEWELKYPEKAKRGCDRRRWRRVLGLDPDIIENYLNKHNGQCDICGNVLTGKWIRAIDHCHKTGAFRGVLCANCNTGLGYFKDNPITFQKAIKYLINPPADSNIPALCL